MRNPPLLILLLFSLSVQAQYHPLSKSDSGIILNNLEKYEFLLGKEDLRGASEALNNAAFVFWTNNFYKEAVDLYTNSLNLNERLANENGIAMINNNLGMLYADLGEYESSLDHFTRTLAARRASQEPVGIISAEVNMAVVLNNLGRYDESVKLLLEALDIAREMYDKYQMRSVYGMLSETYEKMGEVEKSLTYFSFYKSFHEEIQREEIVGIKSELKEERIEKQLIEAEKTKQEMELLKKQLEIYEKDELIQSKDSINQSLYANLSRKEIEIQLLEKENQVKNLEAEAAEALNQKLARERNYLYLIIGIGLLFVIIITLLVRNHNRKTKRYADSLEEKNKSIEIKKAELEEANNLKDRIFSIISHDLRSPISSFRSFFHIIDDVKLEPSVRAGFDSIESQLTNSAMLLENLLSWSISQIKKEEPRIEEVVVSEVVEENFQFLKIHADKKNQALVNSVKKGSILQTDRQILTIVLRNLIQNAIKFTPKGGRVEVTFDSSEWVATIQVLDNGLGMTAEKIKTLFSISKNRSSSGTDKEKGSGLGLILCKELVEKANGMIEVESTPNKGSSFKLKFNKVKI